MDDLLLNVIFILSDLLVCNRYASEEQSGSTYNFNFSHNSILNESPLGKERIWVLEATIREEGRL